jgi:recombinational DNA repair ATPase RecF
MKLIAFRVQKFRNIIDSEEVAIQPDVSNLVGKNESGKTAALNALYRLNPAYGEKFDVGEHYPRWMTTLPLLKIATAKTYWPAAISHTLKVTKALAPC